MQERRLQSEIFKILQEPPTPYHQSSILYSAKLFLKDKGEMLSQTNKNWGDLSPWKNVKSSLGRNKIIRYELNVCASPPQKKIYMLKL